MSLSTARSPPRAGRYIPLVATEGFLAEQNLLVTEATRSTFSFPYPLFLPAGLIDARGELKNETRDGPPANTCSFAEHWNCPTSTAKPVANATMTVQEESSGSTMVATAEDLYIETALRWGLYDIPRNDMAVRAKHGLHSILVCGQLVRPGGRLSTPVIQVVACPTPTSDTIVGSPWTVSEDQMPKALDNRNSCDRFDIYLGSFRCASRNRTLSALQKESIESYMTSAVFGYSTNGALFNSILMEASHVDEKDEALEKGSEWTRVLYCSPEEGRKRLSDRDWDWLLERGQGDPNRTVAWLPKCIPLPKGSPLPPGVLAAANIGSENLIRAMRDQWGSTTSDFMSCNLIREWLDAVARETQLFVTHWSYVCEYSHLWNESACFVDKAENEFRLAMLRHTGRMHFDAMGHSQKHIKNGIPRLLALCERVRDIVPCDQTMADECPASYRFEVMTLLAPKSKSWRNLLSGFTQQHAWMPPYLRVLTPVECDARTNPDRITQATLIPGEVRTHSSTDDDASDDTSTSSGGRTSQSQPMQLVSLPPKPPNTLAQLHQLRVPKLPPLASYDSAVLNANKRMTQSTRRAERAEKKSRHHKSHRRKGKKRRKRSPSPDSESSDDSSGSNSSTESDSSREYKRRKSRKHRKRS